MYIETTWLYSWLRFPLVRIVALIVYSIALVFGTKAKDYMSQGKYGGFMAWFCLCLIIEIFLLILGIFWYSPLETDNVGQKLAFYIPPFLLGINFIVIFAFFNMEEYKLIDPLPRVNTSLITIVGVFFTAFMLSVIIELVVKIMSD